MGSAVVVDEWNRVSARRFSPHGHSPSTHHPASGIFWVLRPRAQSGTATVLIWHANEMHRRRRSRLDGATMCSGLASRRVGGGQKQAATGRLPFRDKRADVTSCLVAEPPTPIPAHRPRRPLARLSRPSSVPIRSHRQLVPFRAVCAYLYLHTYASASARRRAMPPVALPRALDACAAPRCQCPACTRHGRRTRTRTHAALLQLYATIVLC